MSPCFVPLIVVSPGQANRGLRIRDPVSLVDLCPTRRDCRVEKSLPDIRGRSLRLALRGDLPPEDCYAETDEPIRPHVGPHLPALVTSELSCVGSTQAEFYYLSQDLGEVHDLAHEESAQMQTIEQSFSQWEISMQQSVAQSALLTDRERSPLSSLDYAAHGQPGAKRSRLILLKPEQTGNPAQIALRQRVIRSRIIF